LLILSTDEKMVVLTDSALRALRNDNCLSDGLGRNFIDYYLRIKEAEIARFQSEVTEWEQREYFELF